MSYSFRRACAAILRSSVAHGQLKGVDAREALALPGVHAVITAANIGAAIPTIPLRQESSPEFKPFEQPVIAYDTVRYVGEPIAVVLADSAALAEDGVGAIANVMLAVRAFRIDLDTSRDVYLAGESFDLLDGVRHVDDRDLVRHGQTVGIHGGEIAHEIGERAADRFPVALHQTERTKGADLGVENLGLDAVAVHRFEPGVRLLVPGMRVRLHVEVLDRHGSAAAQLGVDARLSCRRIVECLAEPGRHPFTDGVERDGDVGVCRDET